MSPNQSKSSDRVFKTLIVFSGGGLSVVEMGIFQLCVGVKASLVESQQMTLFPFMFLSCCMNFLSCSFHVPFIMHSCPVIVRRYVSNIQVVERLYAQSGEVGLRPNARSFASVVIVFK